MGSGALKPGDLDRRITIEALGPEVDDGMRVKPGGWFSVGRVFAGISPLSGGERIAAGENAAFQLQKFRIRRPKAFTITAKQNRLIYASRTYDIIEVQEIDRAMLDLVASSRADDAPEDVPK